MKFSLCQLLLFVVIVINYVDCEDEDLSVESETSPEQPNVKSATYVPRDENGQAVIRSMMRRPNAEQRTVVPTNVQPLIPDPSTNVQSPVDSDSEQPTIGSSELQSAKIAAEVREIEFKFGDISNSIKELKRLILHYNKNKKDAKSLAIAQKYYIDFLKHCRIM